MNSIDRLTVCGRSSHWWSMESQRFQKPKLCVSHTEQAWHQVEPWQSFWANQEKGIKERNKMEDIRKVFTIQWVGPFETFASLYRYLWTSMEWQQTNRWSSESRSQTCLDYAESRQRKTIVNMAYSLCPHSCCSDRAKYCGERAVWCRNQSCWQR